VLVHILSIFPRFFESALSEGVLRIAREKGVLDVRIVDIRTFATDRHKTTDDYPYGGGVGMIMKPEPVVAACESIGDREVRGRTIILSPQGTLLTQRLVNDLAGEEKLTLIAGRYKAIDERVHEVIEAEELSIGDFVLAGGELPALVVVEAVARLLPGVLGDLDSARGDSFESALLDSAYYTRPEVFRGRSVPEALRSGDHERIRRWRRRDALRRTLERRPDLLARAPLTTEDAEILGELGAYPSKGPSASAARPRPARTPAC
jgi:tRNA (guanine37-N1)-methyltransferase